MTTSTTILGDVNYFLMLSRLAINAQNKPPYARLRQQTNQATAELLEATIRFKEPLEAYRHDYDLFCNNLALLGGFEEPYSVDGMSADWILPFQLINNDLGTLMVLYGVLAMMPINTRVELPLSQRLIDLLDNDRN